jgi:hypothetical protein
MYYFIWLSEKNKKGLSPVRIKHKKGGKLSLATLQENYRSTVVSDG